MYEFNYKYSKSKYTANLLLTETDGLVYETEIEHVYENFYGGKDLFDFSDYPQDSMEL